ncbi:Pilus assembly protein [Balamuthia mandrillaris]
MEKQRAGEEGEKGCATVKDNVRVCLDAYADLSKQLIRCLLSPSRGGTAEQGKPQQLMRQILEQDAQLLRCVAQLRSHQLMQQKIAKLEEQVQDKDKLIAQLAIQLKAVEGLLLNVIEESKASLGISREEEGETEEEHGKAAAAELSPLKGIKVDEVVSYAHKISYTTAAPPNWNPSMPLLMFRPPAPQEEQIRAGLHYTLTELPDFSTLAASSGASSEAQLPLLLDKYFPPPSPLVSPFVERTRLLLFTYSLSPYREEALVPTISREEDARTGTSMTIEDASIAPSTMPPQQRMGIPQAVPVSTQDAEEMEEEEEAEEEEEGGVEETEEAEDVEWE